MGDISFTSNFPFRCFIEALEDSEVLLTELSSIQKLNKYIPESAAQYETALQKSMEAKNQRILSSLSATAEERYNDFLKKYPSLLQRVPQHMIASYLWDFTRDVKPDPETIITQTITFLLPVSY